LQDEKQLLQLQLEAETERLTRELKETNSQDAMQQLQLEAEVQRLTRELKESNSQGAMQQLQLDAEDFQRLTRELKESNSQGAMQQQQLEAELQRMTTALAQANSQLAMHQVQTRQLEEEMHKLKPQLPATEAAAGGQDAARASPSDAASSMQQQPQSLRERELEAEVQKLKAQLEATAKLAQHPDLALLQSYPEWLEVDGFLTGLKAMDDKNLREIFEQFADIIQEAENSAATEAATGDVSDNAADAEAKEKAAAEAETDKRRLSKQGLAKMFETKNVTLSKGKLEELMSRIDTDGNGQIDWLEFRALARSNSDLEMFFKGLPLERVLASCFARGAADQSLEAFFRQQHSDVVAGVLKAGHIIEAMIADHIKKQNEARASQEQAAGGAKYGAELKGGTVEKFFEGVTGICGEPHPGVCVWSVCVCKTASPRGLSDTPWGFTTHTHKTLSFAMLPSFIPNTNPNQPCFYLSDLSSPIFSFYILFI
jgi:hypothetical protein